MAHVSNPAPERPRQDDCLKFQASLGLKNYKHHEVKDRESKCNKAKRLPDGVLA